MADSRTITKDRIIDPAAIPGIKADLQDLLNEINLTIAGFKEMAASLQKNIPSNIPKTSAELKEFQTNVKKSEVLQNGLTEAQKRAYQVTAEYNEILRQERELSRDRAKNVNAEIGSINQLTQKQRELNNEYKNMASSNPNFAKTQQELKGVTDQLNNLRKAAGDYRMQVGNYTLATNKWGESIRKVTELTRGMTGITGVLLKILGVDREIVEGVHEAHATLREVMRSEGEVRKGLAKDIEKNTAALEVNNEQLAANTAATEEQTVANQEIVVTNEEVGESWLAWLGPIGLIIAAIGVVAAAILAYTTSTKAAKEAEKERTKTIDGLSIADKQLRQEHNENLKLIKELNLEYEVFNGTLSETDAKIQKLAYSNKIALQEIDNDTTEKLQDATKWYHSLWNSIKDVATMSGFGAHSSEEIGKIMEDAANKIKETNLKAYVEELRASIEGLEKDIEYMAKAGEELDKLKHELNATEAKGKLGNDETTTGAFERENEERQIQYDKEKADRQTEREAQLVEAKNDEYKKTAINAEFNLRDEIAYQEFLNNKKDAKAKYDEEERKAAVKAYDEQIKANDENLKDFLATEKAKQDELDKELETRRKILEEILKNQTQTDKLTLRRDELKYVGNKDTKTQLKGINVEAQDKRDIAADEYQSAQQGTDDKQAQALKQMQESADKAKELGVYNQKDFDKQKADIDKNYADESKNNLMNYNLDIQDINKKQAEEIRKIKQKQTDEEIKQMQDVLKAAEQITQQRLALAKNALDVQMQMLQTQAEVQATLAGEGKQNSLDATLAAEAKASEQEKEIARKDQQAKQATEMAEAFMNSYNSLVKAGKTPEQAIVGALLAVGEVKALTAGLAAAFFKGTDNTGPGGNLDSQGGFLAMLHPIEAVINRQRNEEAPGLSKAWLTKGNQGVKDYVMNTMLTKDDIMQEQPNDAVFGLIAKKLENIEKNTGNPPIKIAYKRGDTTYIEEEKNGNSRTRIIEEPTNLRM